MTPFALDINPHRTTEDPIIWMLRNEGAGICDMIAPYVLGAVLLAVAFASLMVWIESGKAKPRGMRRRGDE